MNTHKNIPPAEMEILQYILENAPVTVRAVADHFGQTRGLARTTVLTVMERLRQKGHLKREAGAAGYQYMPDRPKSEMQRSLVADFIERSLGGSVSPFVAYLADRAILDESDMEAVNHLLEKLAQIDRDSEVTPDKMNDRGDER
jgi:predicted transcriptional regulator